MYKVVGWDWERGTIRGDANEEGTAGNRTIHEATRDTLHNRKGEGGG